MTVSGANRTFAKTPMSEKCQEQTCSALFDHLVGADEQSCWNVDADGLRGFEVDCKLESCRLLDRQICRFCTVRGAIDILCSKRTHCLDRLWVSDGNGSELTPFVFVRFP